MKLKISGKTYDVERGISKATLQTLLVMQRDYGVNMAELAERAQHMQHVTDPREVLGNPELLQTLLVMIWLGRRYEGEDMTLEESSAIPFDEISFEPDEAPEPAADPKELTGSAADGEPPAAAAATTSKTSKRRSTKTSRTSATSGQG